MSRRVRRVERLVKEVLDEILRLKIKGQPLPMLSITMVKVTADLRYARVYISALMGENETVKAVERLDKMKGYIRSLLGKQMHVRYTPEIRFLADDSIAQGNRILDLMKEIDVDGDGRSTGNKQTGRDDLP
jgi:ribosome-binding factor A